MDLKTLSKRFRDETAKFLAEYMSVKGLDKLAVQEAPLTNEFIQQCYASSTSPEDALRALIIQKIANDEPWCDEEKTDPNFDINNF